VGDWNAFAKKQIESGNKRSANRQAREMNSLRNVGMLQFHEKPFLCTNQSGHEQNFADVLTPWDPIPGIRHSKDAITPNLCHLLLIQEIGVSQVTPWLYLLAH
jgi:hypothetical protein